MIVRSGLPLTLPVLFSSGHPDGDLTWRVLGALGNELASGTVAVPADAVSVVIPVAAPLNALPAGSLVGSRDVEWTYSVGGQLVVDELRYSIEARAPYGASNAGVRAKLGVEAKDLPDSDISLIRAFVGFRDVVTADRLSGLIDEADTLAVRDAIEAQAALNLIPTMAVRVAVSEDSGTNAYKRQTIDWGAIAENLSGIVSAGVLAVYPSYDPSPTGALFLLATPSNDPITGGSYG